MLGALSLPAVGGIDVAKFAGVPGVVDTPSANELSGNQYEDVTSENVSPMANIQELFMEMAQGFMEGINIERELRGRMADDEYQYTIYKKNRNKKTKSNGKEQ